MKTKLTSVIALLICLLSVAQNGINYKAAIKDTNGNRVANQSVTLQFSILKGAGQSNEYTETHTATTDANGIAIVNIGEGTPISGNYSSIAWGSDSHWLNVKVNIGSGLVNMGTTEFKAVPYALNVTGLERITENGKSGWRLIGQNPDNFENIGFEALELSRNTTQADGNGATGNYATTLGVGNVASEVATTAMGYITRARGPFSTAFGYLSEAKGHSSTAMGLDTKAEAAISTAIGQYNVGGGNPLMWIAADPLFEIGNGTNYLNRKNALTVYKNGNLKSSGSVNLNDGIASGVALSVNGAEAIWYNGTYFSWGYGGTANLFADNVGIGIVAPNVALDVNGSIEYTGTITGVSDKRLKENFLPIENTLAKIQNIQGYSYNMIDDLTKQRSYGVIAQDVQKVFPEMVSVVNTEKGYLGVSYIQLIPVLLEAIKEQQTIIEIQNSQLKTQDFKIESLSAELSELQNLAQRVNQIEKLLKTSDQ